MHTESACILYSRQDYDFQIHAVSEQLAVLQKILDIQHLTPHLFLPDKTKQGRTASAYNESDDRLTEWNVVFTSTDSC